jgi:8-oxo-dGTP pyrophosphatase MutT (NUDIX family)
MALLDRFRSSVPFSNDPARSSPSQQPLDAIVGHTAPEPPAAKMPRPSVGLAPLGQSGRANFWGLPQPDEVNPELIGAAGLRRFNQMYRQDPHVRRLVLAAWSPIVAGTWTLEPFGGDDATDQDRQIAEDIWWALTNFMTPNFQEHLLEIGALLLRSGFLPCEQVWGTVERNGKTLLMPRSLQVRLPISIWKWWQDDFGQLTHVGQILPNKPDVVIPATELLYYRLGAEGDNWAGTSLLRHAYRSWYLKDKLEMIDVIGQERKAVGLPVIYPPAGADETVKAEVEELFMNVHMSEAAYAMMPGPKAGSQGQQGIANQEWLVDVIQFDSSSGGGILESIAYHQTGISASFLTDFLELGHHQVGARATAEVQEDPFLTAINGALLPPVVPTLNRLIDRIRCLNWEDADGSPTLNVSLNDVASLSEIAAFITPLVQAEVIQVDPELEDWVRERADMPPANADIRQQNQQAREAGLQAASQQLATNGETKNEEPPSPNSDPAEQGVTPPAGQSAKPAAEKPNANPIAGAVKSTGKIPAAGKTLEQVMDDVNLTILDTAGPAAAGVAVHAADTGRVLVCKRSFDDTDDPNVRCSYEFPGGKLDPADAGPWSGAKREFTEETGAQLPSHQHIGSVDSPDGNYRLHVVRIAHESDVPLGRNDRGEVSAMAWQAPGSLREGETSDRARALLPGVESMIARNPPMALDATMSSVASSQLVATIAGCTCEDGGSGKDERCTICGGIRKRTLDAPQPITPGDRVRRVAGDLGLIGPEGSVTALKVNKADGAIVHDVAWDDGTASRRVRGSGLRKLDATAEPQAKWFESLLSKDQLQTAFDGCRDHIEAACASAVNLFASKIAHQVANGTPVNAMTAPPELADALTQHYADLYALGHQTVQLELGKQRAALGKQLDAPATADAGLTGSRLARARARGEHSAQNIVNRVTEQLGRDQITGLKDAGTLNTLARQSATAQLRKEALANVTATVNDGRNDAATGSPDVVGGYYTSCMDATSCDPCIEDDTGELLAPSDAVALGPPNPDCLGGDFCRCTIIWVLSDDPAALASVT